MHVYWDNIFTKKTFPKQTRTKNITLLAYKAKWCNLIRWKSKELITSVSLSTGGWVCLVPDIFGTRSLPGDGYTRGVGYTRETGIPVASTRGRVYQGVYRPPPPQHTSDGHKRGLYTSYLNAFLLNLLYKYINTFSLNLSIFLI